MRMFSGTDRPYLYNISLRLAAAILAVGSSLLFCPGAVADPLQDRMEALAGSKNPVGIEADELVYDRGKGIYTATGHVKISQGDMVLTADGATLDINTGQAEATGRVTLTDRENVLLAEGVSVNFDTSLGVIEKGRIFVKKENYHIEGERLERVSADEYRVVSGSLTTCDAKTPFWRVTADNIDVRLDKDVQARNVVVRIKEVPVLYSPYAWFPLLKPRTTGFLIPGVGFSTDDGFRLFNSFYWAPADNFDATFSVDYRSRRGAGLGSEFRLALDRDSETLLRGYYMDDRKDLRERYNVGLRHRQLIMEKLTVKADVNLSDRQFFKDLAETTIERTRRSVDSNLFVTRPWENSTAYLFSQYTLGLDVNRDVVVQRVPEIGMDVIAKRVGDTPFYLDSAASAAYFTKKEGVSGGRFDLYPKLTGVFNLGGIRVLPRIGYREIIYSISGVDKRRTTEPITGAVTIKKLRYDDEAGYFGSGITLLTELSRLYAVDGEFLKAVKHTIEPRVAYNYVLMRGGSRFPKFDGLDTLGRRSMVAYGLTNRFVFKYDGGDGQARLDYLTFKLGQFYDYYEDVRVSGVNRHFSSLYGEVVYMASYGLTLNADFSFDFYKRKITSVNTDLKYEESGGMWHAVVGQRFSLAQTGQTFMSPSRFDFFTPSTDFVSEFVVRQDEAQKVNFLLFEAGVKLTEALSLNGKVWYDIRSENFRETDLAAQYESQCWGIRTEFVKRPGERQILVMFTFKGIGSVKI